MRAFAAIHGLPLPVTEAQDAGSARLAGRFGSASWWLSHSGRLDGSVSQGGREPVRLGARAWFVTAGQAGRQAGVSTGYGRLAAIWRIRHRPGAWRAAATSPRVVRGRLGVVRPDHRDAPGRYQPVHGTTPATAPRAAGAAAGRAVCAENPERALTGMTLPR